MDTVDRNRIDYNRDVLVISGGHEFITGTADNNRHLDARPATFLSDEAYGEALNALVPTCVDLLMIGPDRRTVLLGRRRQEPQPDWWVIGGRMRTRETYEQAARRNVKRELGIDLDFERFEPRPVGVLNLIWDTRAQEPVQDGSHTLSLSFLYFLERDEVARMNPNSEYELLQFWSLDAPPQPAHPALIQMMRLARGYIE